ncbi:MAG TPA: zf-HC2 domain-containing protein [Blastocatellia bacterium]|nr:zf-HC2 domain-containing protein [Blastocatellia bacterium]
MKCDDCVAVLEEYIDGELDEKKASPVRTHLSACSACASVYQSLSEEQLVYARYERDLDVGPAMWAAIEARIKHEPVQAVAARRGLREIIAGLFATPRMSFAYTAAIVLIAVGSTVAVMSYLQKNTSNDPVPVADGGNQTKTPTQTGQGEVASGEADGVKPPQPNKVEEDSSTTGPREIAQKPRPRPQAPKQPPSPEQLVREAEGKYLAAIAILTRDVNRRRSKIEPEVLAKFDNALASINRAIEETRAAARKNPDDPVALQYMLAAYSKKVDLLRGMARN